MVAPSPPVSIGLPVHNGANYLREALDGLCDQTVTDFELIVCDNASTDTTADIVSDAAKRDPRIRWLRSPVNRGAAANYNWAFQEARGEFFKWAAHDDRVAPTFLERCLDEFSAGSGSMALAYPQTVIIDAAGSVLREFEDRLDLRQTTAAARLWAFSQKWQMANPLMGLIRRETLGRTGLIRPYPAADLVLLAELAMRGELHEVPDRLFERRFHSTSATRGDADVDLSVWFAGTAGRRYRTSSLARIFWGTNAAVLTSTDLPVGTRVECSASFTASWALKRLRVRAGRLRHRARTS